MSFAKTGLLSKTSFSVSLVSPALLMSQISLSSIVLKSLSLSVTYPISNSTQENAVVIDTFGGSGSTLMACEQMNRICFTMELDEKYASVILRRYVENTGNADGVFVVRNGEKISYADLVKEVERG